jgi:hypothetical protein
MQRAGVHHPVGVLVLPVRQDRLQFRVGELLVAAGGVGGGQIGLIDDLGAPRFAGLRSLAGPSRPAVPLDDFLERLLKSRQPGAVPNRARDGRLQIGQQIRPLRAGDDE